jgi:hypothetical protein
MDELYRNVQLNNKMAHDDPLKYSGASQIAREDK